MASHASDPGMRFQETLAPAVSRLMSHPLYEEVNSLPRLRQFMREHVFAVWDFMSLLKRLQRELCGTGLPWQPPAHPDLARFVNEIVLAEESDIDGLGGYTSHFELYLAAMRQIDAETGPIEQLLDPLSTTPASHALEALDLSPETRDFVRFNLTLAEQGHPWEVAAAFCYGREDIIPEMFTRLLSPLSQQRVRSERFEYYLKRHVELDGETHGPLARVMVKRLVAGDSGREAEALNAALQAIEMRIKLWDGILEKIETL